MNTEIPKENVEINKNNYLLENDRSYKILLLYILRTLNNDVKQKIFKILINEEIVLESEKILHLIKLEEIFLEKITQEISCLTNQSRYIFMELRDIERLDLVYEQDNYEANKRQKH